MFQPHFSWRRALFVACLLWLCWLPQRADAADAVVSGACTETQFDAALTTVQTTGGGTITFACGGAKTITLTAQKNLIANTTLDGSGLITLSGGDATRLFFVNGGVRFVTNNITLRNGSSAVGGGLVEAAGAQMTFNNTRLLNSRADAQGGAIYCFVGTDGTLTLNNSTVEGNLSHRGGGIYNDGCAMTVNNTQLLNNRATLTSTGGTAGGGGIYNATGGQLTIVRSTLQGNNGFDGGALYVAQGASALIQGSTIQSNQAAYGAGLENSGVVTVTDSLLHDNRAENVGGGLWNLTGRVVMTRTTVSANRAFEGGGINSYGDHVELYTVNVINNQATGSDGGGIYHTGGTFFVTNATISGNRAKLDGGGIHQNSGDNLVLRNVTISGNQAERFGGGFHHRARFAILTNVTLGNNTAPAGNALYESADGSVGPGVLQLTNTLIFGSANNCDGNLFQSGGHNLTAGSCSSLANATDRQVNDAGMSALSYNGGFFVMQTHLPLTGSPAINGGDSASCSATDQRGAARVGVCDVGAVEADAALPRGYLPLITK
jgi:hypothetical protein